MPGLATGTLAADAFRVGTTAADASDRIIYNGDTGTLFFDQDGSGAAKVQFATLDSGLAMSNQDFRSKPLPSTGSSPPRRPRSSSAGSPRSPSAARCVSCCPIEEQERVAGGDPAAHSRDLVRITGSAARRRRGARQQGGLWISSRIRHISRARTVRLPRKPHNSAPDSSPYAPNPSLYAPDSSSESPNPSLLR